MNKEWFNQLPVNKIRQVTPVSGGDVNDAYKIATSDHTYFLLVQPNAKKEFFAAEAAGLKDLKRADITVPDVYDVGEINQDAYLLISYLEEGPPGNYWDLAKLIAKMHHIKSPNGQFGYHLPHQGADTTFSNAWTESWIELFVERRLDELRDELVQTNEWSQKQIETYTKARLVIVEELTRHKSEPSLLHGDLWGGNHMFLTNGEPALFDPAPFYGDREFDLGVTTSFGVYPQEFYASYQEVFPLKKGFEKRLPFYRLYVFMVHLHKFGGIYKRRVDQTLEDIIG